MENNNRQDSLNSENQDKTSIENLNSFNSGKPEKDSQGISAAKAGAMAAGAGIAGAGLGAAGQGYLEKGEKVEEVQASQVSPIPSTVNPDPVPANVDNSATPTNADTATASPTDSNVPVASVEGSEAVVEASGTEQQAAYMGIAVDAGNGNTVQVVFVDVNHDGIIDEWGMQATDVTGATQQVAGTPEQLSDILFGGNANYAQQVDYQNESGSITGMDDNFEPIDWASEPDAPVVAEETEMQTIEIEAGSEEIPEAEVSELPGESASASEDFSDYEQQMEHVQFQDWELPDSYQQDDFQGNDDFVTNQFI